MSKFATIRLQRSENIRLISMRTYLYFLYASRIITISSLFSTEYENYKEDRASNKRLIGRKPQID